MTGTTRRAFLGLAGAAVGGTAGCLGGGSDYDDGWNEANSGTDDALYGVAAVDGGYLAVGDGATLTVRQSTDHWTVHEPPTSATGSTLRCAAPTNDAKRAWFAGDDGVVGVFDARHDDVEMHDDPLGSDDSVVDVAVDGDAGGESVSLVTGDGAMVRGSRNKRGQVTWEMKKTPGQGEVVAVSFTEDDIGYLCTGAGEAFQNVGKGWKQVGVPEVSQGLTDVTGHEESLLDVASKSGRVYRYNGYQWRTIDVADHSLDAITREGRHGLAVSLDGAIYSLDRQWHRSVGGLPENLHDATTGTSDGPEVCVGANGFVVERSK